MKKALLVLLATAGCNSGGGSASEKSAEIDFETKVATSIFFDAALLKPGDRVRYLVKRQGEDTQRYDWTAVAAEGTAIWIENNVPNQDTRVIWKVKLDRSGKVLEEWVGEPGGVPARRYSSAGKAEAPRQVRDSSTATADSKEEPDRIVVSGRPYDCTRVTTKLTYPTDKRTSVMINWFSKEVPFAATKTLGGLVKRQFGRLSMELLSFDGTGKAELLIPPPQK